MHPFGKTHLLRSLKEQMQNIKTMKKKIRNVTYGAGILLTRKACEFSRITNCMEQMFEEIKRKSNLKVKMRENSFHLQPASSSTNRTKRIFVLKMLNFQKELQSNLNFSEPPLLYIAAVFLSL